MPSSLGHEDLDQVFGELAGYIGRLTHDNPDQLIELVDAATRPANAAEALRKESSQTLLRRQASASKLDQCAPWKQYTSQIGIRLKGLRSLDACLGLTRLSGHMKPSQASKNFTPLDLEQAPKRGTVFLGPSQGEKGKP